MAPLPSGAAWRSIRAMGLVGLALAIAACQAIGAGASAPARTSAGGNTNIPALTGGTDVVDAIGQVATNGGQGVPNDPVIIESIAIGPKGA